MTLNRALFFTIIGLLLAVLFIPLFVSNNLFFPFITGKNFAFRIIVEIAALAWVVLMLRDKSYRPKFSWLTIAVTLFIGIVAVADIFGSNPVKAFLSNFERMEGWISIAHFLVYYLILVSVLRTWPYWRSFLQVTVGVSAISIVQGFMQAADPTAASGSRIYASLGNAEYLAVYMLFHIFITAILLVRHLKDRGTKPKGLWDTKAWYTDWLVYLYAVMMILQTVILFLTATRGAILGLIGGLIIAAIFVVITEKEHKIVRKISVGVLVVIALLIGIFFLAKNSAFVQHNVALSRLASISLSDGTTKSRLMIWNMSWHGVTDSPKHFVIGWGQEGYNYVFAKYYNPGMYGQEQWFDRAHDIVFDWLTQAGMLGLLSYLSIFVCALYCLWKKSNLSNLEKSLITGLLAGYFFHNIFVFDHVVSYILFFSVLAYINWSAEGVIIQSPIKVHGKNQKTAETKELDEAYRYAGMIVAAIILIGIFYQYNYKAIAANLALMSALQQTQLAPTASSTSPSLVYTQANVDAFKEAISYNTIGLYETREQLMDIAAKSVGGNSENSVKQGLVTLAQTEVARQLQETPNDIRYYVLGGTFFQNIGDYKDAAPLLLKAKELSPTKQSALFALGSNYFAMGQQADALATFKTAYELDKSFTEAKTLYGLVAFYAGQEKVTNDLLGPGPIMDARFLQAYKATKHYDLMIAYLQNSE